MAHGGGVKTGLVTLQRAAVELLVIAVTRTQLERDRLLVPLAITIDVVGVQPGGGQGAVPTPKQPRLCSDANAALPTSSRRCVTADQCKSSPHALGGLDQGNNRRLGPARPADDRIVPDPGFLDRLAIRAEMIRRRRHQRLLPAGQPVVRKINPSL